MASNLNTYESPKNRIWLFLGEQYGLSTVQPLTGAALQALQGVLLWAALCEEDRAPFEG